MYDKIHSGYTGGAVDVYVKANREFPVGTPIPFEGNLDLIKDNLFGIVIAEIEAPADCKYPLLQYRINNKTVSGIGIWTGWYFTEELKKALSMGYKVKVLSGFKFERGYIFKDFVTKIYNLRKLHAKGTPMNLICKLIMNSLYGKFGIQE